ncbi:DUF560 domain-containing protein [Candidatus Poribacteria bacterium]|nr:DUF560 domain-containing protein [Candidatus Poribacteria bacterium]
MNGDWRMGAVPRIWTTCHDHQPDGIDPAGRSLALSVSRRVPPGSLGSGWLTAGATFARETADQSSQDWRSQGLSLEYATQVGENWSGSVRLGRNEIRFDEQDAAFLVRCKDVTRNLGLTLSHRRVSREDYQPILMLDWSRTESCSRSSSASTDSFRFWPEPFVLGSGLGRSEPFSPFR